MKGQPSSRPINPKMGEGGVVGVGSSSWGLGREDGSREQTAEARDLCWATISDHCEIGDFSDHEANNTKRNLK